MLKTGMMHKSHSYTLVTWGAEAHVGETFIAATFFAHLCDTDGIQINNENPHTCRHKKTSGPCAKPVRTIGTSVLS